MEIEQINQHIAFKNNATVQEIEAVSTIVNSIEFIRCKAQGQVWVSIFGALSKNKSITTLRFDGCDIGDNDSPQKAELALSRLQQLTSLTLEWCHLGPRAVRALSQLVNLSELNLCGNNLKKVDSLSALINLKTLNIGKCGLDNYPVDMLLQLPKLQSLSTDAPQNLQLVGRLQNLTSLRLYRIEHSDEQFKELTKLERLNQLHLSGNFNGNWFTHICVLSNLKQLTINEYEESERIRNLRNLTKLALNQIILDTKVLQALSDLPRLTELALTYNNIGDEGCEHISKMISLTILKLSGNNIGDMGTRFLCKLINLQQLYLGNSCAGRKIGPVGAARLAQLRNLRTLCIDCSDIGDDGAKWISKIQGLQELYIGNSNVGAEGVAALGRLRNLKLLNISYIHIGNEGLFEMRKLIKLKNAIIYQCDIDAKGVQLIGRMTNLTEIYMRSNEISQSKIDKIKRRLKKVNIDAQL